MAVTINPKPPGPLIKYWTPVIIYAVIIFYLSGLPGKDVPELFPHQDILFHIVEYFIFALLLNRALKNSFPGMKLAGYLSVFFLCLIYAASDEYHQLFVPGRFASLSDLAYDGLGIFIAGLLFK